MDNEDDIAPHLISLYRQLWLLSQEALSLLILKIINSLYEVEREAKEMSHKERYELRQKKSKPLLEELYAMLQNAKSKEPPKNKLGQAIQYALNQWHLLSWGGWDERMI